MGLLIEERKIKKYIRNRKTNVDRNYNSLEEDEKSIFSCFSEFNPKLYIPGNLYLLKRFKDSNSAGDGFLYHLGILSSNYYYLFKKVPIEFFSEIFLDKIS